MTIDYSPVFGEAFPAVRTTAPAFAESELKWENHLKYLNYIVRILEKYKKNETPKQIRMIVIYTADIEEAPGEFSVGCLTLKLEQAFLSKIDSQIVQEEIRRNLENKLPLSDEQMMKLIILPLTYKGTERKKQAVKEAVYKIIDTDTAEYIKEVIRMTQVAELLLEEGREEGRKEGREEGRKEGMKESRMQGIQALIDSLKSLLIPDETIIDQLVKRYHLTRDEANAYIQQK